MKKIKLFLFLFLFVLFRFGDAQPVPTDFESVVTGDQQFEILLPMLKNKQVAVVANHTSMVQGVNLVDSLLHAGISVRRIFSPEHGFRGNQDAGAKIKDGINPETGLPVISLYGKHRKPTVDDLKQLDVVVFDLQDVGVRFYTYISTLSLVMEACAEQNIPLIVLDRPNPNGFYVDGPVLQKGFESFVGMHPIPVVYGMTIGEYARMVNGEHWLKKGIQCKLTVVGLKHYRHNMLVKLPIKPSPNLPNWQSVYLYPSLCFFEGTTVSVGRGTPKPFQVFGHPDMKGPFEFVPVSTPGASLHPKFEDKKCSGFDVSGYADAAVHKPARLHLKWLLKAFDQIGKKEKFFNHYFDTLAGTDQLRKQIQAGKSEKQIRKSWKNDLDRFRKIRSKYLLYN
jgi:uncharacterized protein YbbC (DUF1343 family)